MENPNWNQNINPMFVCKVCWLCDFTQMQSQQVEKQHLTAGIQLAFESVGVWVQFMPLKGRY